ncbi:hypothetical protein STEG23_034748 [Scotinomys teguina]
MFRGLPVTPKTLDSYSPSLVRIALRVSLSTTAFALFLIMILMLLTQNPSSLSLTELLELSLVLGCGSLLYDDS